METRPLAELREREFGCYARVGARAMSSDQASGATGLRGPKRAGIDVRAIASRRGALADRAAEHE